MNEEQFLKYLLDTIKETMDVDNEIITPKLLITNLKTTIKERLQELAKQEPHA